MTIGVIGFPDDDDCEICGESIDDCICNDCSYDFLDDAYITEQYEDEQLI